MAHDASPPSAYVFSELNQPFAPADRHSALQLLAGAGDQNYLDENSGVENMRATLVRSWRDVNELTTHNKKNRIAA